MCVCNLRGFFFRRRPLRTHKNLSCAQLLGELPSHLQSEKLQQFEVVNVLIVVYGEENLNVSNQKTSRQEELECFECIVSVQIDEDDDDENGDGHDDHNKRYTRIHLTKYTRAHTHNIHVNDLYISMI